MRINKFFGLSSCMAMLTFLAACGDDSGSNSSNSPENAMESCTVTKNADSTSYVLKCPDGTEVEIHDGRNGENGANGSDGKNGAAGKNGVSDTSAAAGAGCTLKELEGGSVSLECPDGTKLVFGEDGKVAGKGSSSSATGTSSNTGGGTSSAVQPGGNSSSSQAAIGKTQGYVQFNRDVYTTLAGAGLYLYDADNKANSASVTVYSDTPDTLLLNLDRQDGYFYGNLPITVVPGYSNSLFVSKSSNLLVKYRDVSTGVDKYDSAKMNLPDSLLSKPKLSLSFGKSDYYDSTDKAVILLNDSRLTEGVSVTVHVSSDVDAGRDIPMYPVNGGDGSERVGFVGFSVDEPGAGYVKVEDGKSFGVSYGGKSASATWRMTEYFGLNCTEDGKLQKGIKDASETYVFDSASFRPASEKEISLGKGCTSYNRKDRILGHTCMKAWLADSIVEDMSSFIDARDGQEYSTVVIGSQTWMVENLNYKTVSSKCYNDDPANCTKYGRLYKWSAAMAACPSGWHLPNSLEFEALFTAVGGITVAAKQLKSQTGWIAYSGITNEDAFGFSALPAGQWTNPGDGAFFNVGERASFWSSTEVNGEAYYVVLGYSNDDASLYKFGKELFEFSVRCLKD